MGTSSKVPTIRLAKAGDAPGIANVHLNSWRETYSALLPKEYIDRLPLSFKRRMETWSGFIDSGSDAHALWVAEDADLGIVGFCIAAQPRDSHFEDHGELGAIYLLQAFHGTGTGYQLLKAGLGSLVKMGFGKAYCWVLEGNPTIRFYERSGAKPTGIQKPDEIGGKSVQELAYAWPSLAEF